MIFLAPLSLAALFALGAALAGSRRDNRQARRVSVVVSVVCSTLAAAMAAMNEQIPGTDVDLLPVGLLKAAPLVTSLVALLATGLAPLSSHNRGTFARVLLLVACSQAFLATTEPWVLGVLWAGSAWLAWRECRLCDGEERWSRVFALYHGASVGLFLVGVVLLNGGQRDLGVFGLVGAIGIRAGALPLHSWLPRFVEKVPLGVVAAFAGPQLAVYVRLELLDSHGLGALAGVAPTLVAVTAVGAAMLGVVQTNARRAVAYLIISQTGLVAFGLESELPIGQVGAMLNWQVLAIATSAFAMILCALEARKGPLWLGVPCGDFHRTPRLGIAFLILGFASVGFPLTLGFVAEDLLVQGTVAMFPVRGLSLVVATAFNGVTVMRAFLFLFTGARSDLGEPDLTRRESAVVAVAVALLLAFGLGPGPLVDFEAAGGPDASHQRAHGADGGIQTQRGQ